MVHQYVGYHHNQLNDLYVLEIYLYMSPYLEIEYDIEELIIFSYTSLKSLSLCSRVVKQSASDTFTLYLYDGASKVSP